MPALLFAISLLTLWGCMGEWHGIDPQSEPGVSFTVTPASIDFGTITIGDYSLSSVKISNMGTRSLLISHISLSDDLNYSLSSGGSASFSAGMTATITPGESRTVTVRFTPLTASDCYAILMVSCDAPQKRNISVSLAGTGIQTPVPNIRTTPSGLSFGGTLTGSQSKPLVVAIENTGSADLRITDMNLGDSSSFQLDLFGGSTPCQIRNPSIPAGELCTAEVTFSPYGTGTIDGYLSIESDDPDTPTAHVSLSGTGILAPEPDIRVSPTSHSFERVEVGERSLPLVVMISNSGEADLSITDISLTDPINFSLDVDGGASPCGSTHPVVPPGESRTLTAVFGPYSTGFIEGQVIIESDDPDISRTTISLSGVGEELSSYENHATLSWAAPTTNADGTALTDLAGFSIYYGPSSGYYTNVVDVGNVTSYTLEDLPPGTLFITVTAYDTDGNESDYSNEMSKEIY